MLLNLASVVNAEEPAVLWGFIQRYARDGDAPRARRCSTELVGHALAYYRDFVKPAKAYRLPDEQERQALAELASWLERLEIRYGGAGALAAVAEQIQQEVYEIGKRHGYANDLRAWFKALYEILLGQTEGPPLRHLRRVLWPCRNRGVDPAGPGRPADRPARGLKPSAWRSRAARAGSRSTCSTWCWASSARSTRCSPGHPGLGRLAARDRAYARLLVATTLRRLGQIDAVLDRFLRQAPKSIQVRNLLRLGAAQLLFLHTPAHAAVAETVALASGREGFARGLANAVLRRVAREGAALVGGAGRSRA